MTDQTAEVLRSSWEQMLSILTAHQQQTLEDAELMRKHLGRPWLVQIEAVAEARDALSEMQAKQPNPAK